MSNVTVECILFVLMKRVVLNINIKIISAVLFGTNGCVDPENQNALTIAMCGYLCVLWLVEDNELKVKESSTQDDSTVTHPFLVWLACVRLCAFVCE